MAQPYPISRETREEAIFFGDGGAVYGPFALKIFDVDDVEVWTKATGGTWTIATPTVAKVDPALAFDEFTITFAANIPLTTKIKVLSARTHERSAGVTSGTKLSADALEKELTKQGTILQELRRDIDRSVQSEFGDAAQALPAPEAGKVLGWSLGGKLANLLLASTGLVSFGLKGLQLAASVTMNEALAALGLPAITSGRMLVDEDDERKLKTFAEVRDLLDPLRNFYADGVMLDDGNFTALRIKYPNTDFDLYGKTYRVTAIPQGPYHNGYWIIFGAGEGGGNIRFPAPDTVKFDVGTLDEGDRHSGWPQDTWHAWPPDEAIIYAAWKEGDNHASADTHMRLARSGNNGRSFHGFERLFQTVTGARSAWAADAVAGQQCFIVRHHSGAHSDGTIFNGSLRGRRLEERREKRNLGARGDFTGMAIVCTNGSSTVRVDSCPNHGLRAGNRVTISNAATVGGVTVNGTWTVTNRGADWFEFTAGSAATSPASDSVTDFVVTFVEDDFVDIPVDGVTIYHAIKNFAGSAFAAATTFYVHGMRWNPFDPSGGFYFVVAAGGVAPHLGYVTGLFVGTTTLSKLTLIFNSTSRGEGTLTVIDENRVCGFLRTDATTFTGGFFTSTDAGDSVTHWLNDGDITNDFPTSPMPITHVGSKLYAFATGRRTRGAPGTVDSIAGEVPWYMLECDVEDAFTNGLAANWIKTRMGALTYANESHSDVANAVGVGSCVYAHGIIHVGFSDEKYENRSYVIGSPDIVHIRIMIEDQFPAYAKGVQEIYSPRTKVLKRGGYSRLEVGRIKGFGAMDILGFVVAGAEPTLSLFGEGLTLNRVSSGIYQLIFDKAPGHTRYHVNPVANVSATTKFSVVKDIDKFTIYTEAAADRDFSFQVFMNDQYTRTDWLHDLK